MLYEFVFSASENNFGFKICTVLPMQVVPCCGKTISDCIEASSVLNVTKDEDIDVLTYFQQVRRVYCDMPFMHNLGI